MSDSILCKSEPPKMNMNALREPVYILHTYRERERDQCVVLLDTVATTHAPRRAARTDSSSMAVTLAWWCACCLNDRPSARICTRTHEQVSTPRTRSLIRSLVGSCVPKWNSNNSFEHRPVCDRPPNTNIDRLYRTAVWWYRSRSTISFLYSPSSVSLGALLSHSCSAQRRGHTAAWCERASTSSRRTRSDRWHRSRSRAGRSRQRCTCNRRT